MDTDPSPVTLNSAVMASDLSVGAKRPLEAGAVAAAAPVATPAEPLATALDAATAMSMDEAPLKKQQISRLPPKGGSLRETVFRLLAPSKNAGYVIGKGGAQIKELRERTGARIKVSSSIYIT
jgi:hypothetical protein